MLLTVLVAMLGFGGPAFAVGAITDAEIHVTSDGSGATQPADSSTSNKIIASNEKAAFSWSFTTNGVDGATFTQTLPQCWVWDENSFGALNSSSSLYTSSYVLSADKRTVTATISTPQNTLSKVTLANLQATATGDCANGSTYTPELVVTDGGASQTYDSGYQMTVVNSPKLEISKAVSGANTEGSCAGIGACVYQNFDLIITPPTGTGYLGTANATIAEPLILTDTYTISPDIPSARFYVLQTLRGGTATVQSNDPATNTATIAVTNIPNPLPANGITVRVRVAVPIADAPAFSASAPANVVNTVSASPKTTDGTPMIDPITTNNSANGHLQRAQTTTGTRPVVHDKMIYVTKDSATPRYGQLPTDGPNDPFMQVASGALNSTGTVGSSATVYDRIRFRPQYTTAGSVITVVPATNLSMYDFWDPTEQQIIDVPAWVGDDAKTATPAANYQIQYTSSATLTNLSDPASFTWVDSIAAAGGPTKVNGIRLVWLANGGSYAPAWSNTTAFLNLVQPFKVVQDIGEPVTDTSRVTAAEHNLTLQRFFTVVGPDLALNKSVSPSSVASGSTVTYTLDPKVVRPSGGTTDQSIEGLRVVDTLPQGIVAVDTSKVDDAWVVEQTGSAATGITLTFTYQGTASTASEVPDIVFTGTTDIKAPPSGQYINHAVVSGDGNAQAEQARSAQAVLNISQANVTTTTKMVDGPSTIDVGVSSVSWQNSWYNFREESQGAQTFFDVLPYAGDGRGTSFHGTAQLSAAELTGDAQSGAVVYVTTDAPAAVTADPKAATWVPLSGYSGDLAAVTALRTDVTDLSVNYAGGLHITMKLSGQQSGDVYANDQARYAGTGAAATYLGTTGIAKINVVASTLTGTVWWDVNRDGVRQSGETPAAGVTVTVTGAGVNKTAVTASDGTWSVGELPHGSYTVAVAAPTGSNIAFTTANAGSDDAIDSDVDQSGSVTVNVAEGQTLHATDAGLLDAALAVSKQVESAPGSGTFIEADQSDNATGTYVWGDAVQWQITVSNTGRTDLADVVLSDVVPYADTADSCGLATGSTLSVAAGKSVTVTCTSTAYDSVTNTATAAYGAVEVSDTAAITVRADTGVEVVKQVESTPGSGEFADAGDAAPGDTVLWQITATNTGDVTLTDVVITDDLAAAGPIVLAGDAPAECVALVSGGGYVVESLLAGDSVVVECATVVSGSATNVANVDATVVVVPGGEPADVTGSGSAVVTVTDPVPTGPAPTDPAVPTTPTTPAPPKPTAPAAKGGGLATTGVDAAPWLWTGLGLFAAGAVLFMAGRRRKDS